MFSKKRTRQRRKDFLIDTNLSRRKKGKKMRNRFLNFLLQFRFLQHIKKLFEASILLSMLFVLMAIFILVAIFSPYFEVKKISIVRDSVLLDLEQLDMLLEPYYGRNLLFLSQSEVASALQERFPEFTEVSIRETWPSEMEVQLVIAPPFVNIFHEETANFWTLSQDGVVLQPNATEGLPMIELYQHAGLIQKSQKILNREMIQAIFDAKAFFQEELSIQIDVVHLYSVSQEFHLISENNTAFWLDLTHSLPDQLQKLRLADEKIGLYSKDFEHIDLRIPDQIFYKER